MSEGIRRLEESMRNLEEEIASETEKIKSRFRKAAASIPAGQSYYLVGIQTGAVVKAYHFTSEGVGIQGEGVIPISDFIDAALRFANYPKRKIEVLGELAGHIEKIDSMIASQQTT
jgi:hypothetical protein